MDARNLYAAVVGGNRGQKVNRPLTRQKKVDKIKDQHPSRCPTISITINNNKHPNWQHATTTWNGIDICIPTG